MDVYSVDANDLTTYLKHKRKTPNATKPKMLQGNLIIDSEFISKLCFNETLAIVNEKEEELGEFTGKIRTCNSHSDNSSTSIIINVHCTSVSEHDEEIGMSLIAKTTTTFDSYDEKWSQWSNKNSKMSCNTVLVSKKNNDEPIQICTDTNGELIMDKTRDINSKYVKNLLTEGMNYVLLRYLAIIGFEGFIKNKTAITINGSLCKITYECLLKEKYDINKVCIPVAIIKRNLHVGKSSKTPITSMTTVLTRSGYILKHSWGETINKELMIKKTTKISKNGHVHNDTKLDLRKNWDQDIRLKSFYLDKVTEFKMKSISYLEHNGAVKDLIIDFIRDILIAKPDNVLQFSIDFFDK